MSFVSSSSSLLATEISKSGLCDKLIDVITLSSYTHFTNKTLVIPKIVFEQADRTKNFSPSRYHDILVENLESLMDFDGKVKFIDNNQLNEYSTCEVFNTYLGGCYPILDFYQKWLSDICSLDQYLDYFKTEISKHFSFTPIYGLPLLNVNNSYIGLHLRRTDKVSQHPDYGQIHLQELNECDTNTKKACLDLIARGYEDFYVCGDDKEVCLEYIQFLKDNGGRNIKSSSIDFETTGWQKSYVDLYYLRNCYAIIMSCKHSNFSLVPSILGNKKIITVFDEEKLQSSLLYKSQWLSFIDCINYKNLLEINIAIVGHQGVGDYFNQVGLYRYIASTYFNCATTILVEPETILPIVSALFSLPRFNVQLAKTVSKSDGNESKRETCLICHTPCCPSGRCKRDPSKESKFLNEEYHKFNPLRDTKIIKLHSFNNSVEWEKFRNNKPFNVAFYEYQNIPSYIMTARFETSSYIAPYNNHNISRTILDTTRNLLSEAESLKGYKYVVIHDDEQRNLRLNRSLIDTTKFIRVIQLNGISPIMIDTINLLKGASEIHFIDSNYSVMIWNLQHKYGYFKDAKIVLHNSSRPGRDISIYTHNLPKNWIIV